MSEIYFTKDAAQYLGISEGMIYHYVREGRLKGGNWSRHTFTKEQLDKFKETMKPSGAQVAEPKEGCYTASEARRRLGGISRQRLYLIARQYKVGRGLFDREKIDELIAHREGME